MEPKVFYGIRKTTRVATISEAHEAIEGARNVVNVILLPPNAGDFGNQESDTEEVLAESIKKIYEPAGELEIEENLANDDEVEPLLPICSKRRRQELPRWKRTSGFAKDFQQVEPNFKENLSDLEGYSSYQVWKNLFSEDILEHIVLQSNFYSNRDQNNSYSMVSTEEMRLFLECFCLLAIIVYRKNITTDQPSLIWEFQQCIIQSVEPGIKKLKDIYILLTTKGSQKKIK